MTNAMPLSLLPPLLALLLLACSGREVDLGVVDGPSDAGAAPRWVDASSDAPPDGPSDGPAPADAVGPDRAEAGPSSCEPWPGWWCVTSCNSDTAVRPQCRDGRWTCGGSLPATACTSGLCIGAAPAPDCLCGGDRSAPNGGWLCPSARDAGADAPPDGPSPCAQCAAGEICVQFNDSSTLCRSKIPNLQCIPVSDPCRAMLDAQGRCSATRADCQREICGQHFQCRIQVPCGNEVPEARVKCYGS